MPISFATDPATETPAGVTIHVIFHGDADNSPLVPSSASFRLDDTKSGDEIVGWQPLDPIGPTLSITIPHAMRSADRRLTVTAHYPDGATDTGAFHFSVRT